VPTNSVKSLIVLAAVDGIKEDYSNIEILWKKLSINDLGLSVACDLKEGLPD
jgi:hypothetical protein